jgi:periplasmic divalent cation tolerance protein
LPSGLSIVLVTTPEGDPAHALATNLVEEGLAACVNIVPRVRSIYRWEGKIADEAESLLVIKTRTETVEALRARVIELHPYSVPEVIAVDVDRGHAPYLQWAFDQVTARSR